MRKTQLIIMILFMVLTKITFGQNYKKNYFGEDVNLYKNSNFVIDTTSSTGFMFRFYNSLIYCQKPSDDNVIFPEKEHTFSTDINMLKNKIFVVDNIIDKTGKVFTGYPSRINEPILVIRDTLTNEKIYFKYDSKYKHNFPFLTNTILSNEYFCNKLQTKVDEFNGEITIQNPYTSSKQMIYKIIKELDTTYYLSLVSYGSTVNVNCKGVIILFDDGTKFEKPNEVIDVKVGKNDYDYSCFIRMTKEEIHFFTTKKISKYRLYIYDTEVDSFTSESLMNYFTCIYKSK